MGDCAIGIDIGGTHTKVVLLEDSGTVVERRSVASPRETLAELIDAVVAAAGEWRAPGGGSITSVGVAVPGVFDPDSRVVARTPNLPILEGVDLEQELSDAFGVPSRMDNDANVAGLAEARLGAAAGCDVAVCLTVGTGVGGALIVDGRLFRGAGGMAGEVGQLILDDSGEELEQGVGAAAVVAGYRERGGHLEVDDAADVTARADAGEEAARQALAACGMRLGAGIAVLISVLNPQRVVIGGGVSGAGKWLLEPARRVAEERTSAPLWQQCEVVRAALGADAGAIGAALLAAEFRQ